MSEAVLSIPRTRRETVIAAWLLACCAAIFAMVVIGGITRLTESGLSITEWQPLMGAIPPLSDAEWQRVFDLYRQTPEYRNVNIGMTLAEFQTIFWWEYIHRLWGRLIGLIFFVPLIVFALRGWLDRGLGLKLLGIFALGGVQGAIGWWMVTSGLVDRTDVSPYRLTVHLGVAFLIYALALWIAMDLLAGIRKPAPARIRRFAWIVFACVSLTVLTGAFVAGTNAGFIYNTFPLMGGQFLPPDYFALDGFRNAFENPAAVQFHHRVFAIGTVLVILAFLWRSRESLTGTAAAAASLLLLTALVQASLGIATLLLVVPIPLAALHQAGALMLFTTSLWAVHALGPSRKI